MLYKTRKNKKRTNYTVFCPCLVISTSQKMKDKSVSFYKILQNRTASSIISSFPFHYINIVFNMLKYAAFIMHVCQYMYMIFSYAY